MHFFLYFESSLTMQQQKSKLKSLLLLLAQYIQRLFAFQSLHLRQMHESQFREFVLDARECRRIHQSALGVALLQHLDLAVLLLHEAMQLHRVLHLDLLQSGRGSQRRVAGGHLCRRDDAWDQRSRVGLHHVLLVMCSDRLANECERIEWNLEHRLVLVDVDRIEFLAI